MKSSLFKIIIFSALLVMSLSLFSCAHEHRPGIWTYDVPPGCNSIGSMYATCLDCGERCGERILQPIGHSLKSYEAREASCTEVGHDEYSACTRCDYTTKNEISPSGHELERADAKAPTCVDVGYSAYEYCLKCDYSTRRDIAALGHSTVKHAAKSPTCIDPGCAEYYTCRNCDYTTYTEIAPLGHDMVDYEELVPTCTSEGWLEYSACTRCDHSTRVDISPSGHALERVAAKEPTCTDIGWYEYEFCTACDYSDYTERPALGHSNINHPAKAPTCTDAGWNAYVGCSRCGLSDCVYIPAVGHTLVSAAAKAPTCTEPGWSAHLECNKCDYSERSEIAALGHVEIARPAKAPTCTEPGYKDRVTCSRCDLDSYTEIPATGHAKIKYAESVPTCTDGGWYEYYICSVCGDSNFEMLDPLGHSYLRFPAKSPTCTTSGNNEYEICLRCGASDAALIPPLGHSLTSYGALAPGCIAAGHNAYEACSRCEYTTYIEIPALGHSEAVIPGRDVTCTEIGYTDGTLCADCGSVLKAREPIPALGHSYTADGGNRCERCGIDRVTECEHAETVIVDGVPPSCTSPGLASGMICASCGAILLQQGTIDPLGHDLSAYPAVLPTCESGGNNEYEVCSRCDYTTYRAEAALGHTPVSMTDIPPECTVDGRRGGMECYVCGKTLSAPITIPATGHAYDSELDASCNVCGGLRYDYCLHPSLGIIPAVPAGCTESGLCEGVRCNVCLAILAEQTPTDPLGHNYVDGVCTRCGGYASGGVGLVTVRFVISELGYSDRDTVTSLPIHPLVIAIDSSVASSDAVYRAQDGSLRLYKGARIVISAKEGYNVRGIGFECVISAEISTESVRTENAEITKNADVINLTPCAEGDVILTVISDTPIRIAAITVIYN